MFCFDWDGRYGKGSKATLPFVFTPCTWPLTVAWTKLQKSSSSSWMQARNTNTDWPPCWPSSVRPLVPRDDANECAESSPEAEQARAYNEYPEQLVTFVLESYHVTLERLSGTRVAPLGD